MSNLKIGSYVVFDPKVLEPPYAPYYDDYETHLFKVVAFHEGEHIELECVCCSNVKVNGCVHHDELILFGHKL